jgi:hypothetical protein
MGRDFLCSDEERREILRLRHEGKTFNSIKRLLGCSAKLITNVFASASAARVNFAEQHLAWSMVKWNAVLWSDECTIIAPNSIEIRVWGCFSGFAGVGPIHWVQHSLNATSYTGILERRMLPYADWNMPLRWHFQQDNDPVHISKK